MVFVRSDPVNASNVKPKYQVLWQCCKQKGLPYRLMKPNHHTNVSVSPLECEIIDEQ